MQSLFALACLLPGHAKDLSAPRLLHNFKISHKLHIAPESVPPMKIPGLAPVPLNS